MIFKKIKYSNYRCFMDGVIEFSPNKNNNMSIIVAPNGGGKTETLFSFWWALYDFDFKSLRNKENTPYSINSELYRELENSEEGTTKTCSVSLEFEEKNKIYYLTKREEFRKTPKTIKKEIYKELRWTNENGETSTTLRDLDKIESILNKIIPRRILNGILFDGERMQKLNSADESSVEAIKGVINDISNVDLLEKCSLNFERIKKSYNDQLKKFNRKIGTNDLNTIISEINNLEKENDTKQQLLDKNADRLSELDREIENISIRLKQNQEVAQYEEQRVNAKISLKAADQELDDYYKQFSNSLSEYYISATTKLLDDVEQIVNDYKVPEGLSVNAVKSILNNEEGKCICGKTLDEESIKTLKELIKYLPPDNINSKLLEIIRGIKKVDIPNSKETIKNKYNDIKKKEKSIKAYKDTITSLSAQILAIDETGEMAKQAKKLEIDYQNKLKEIGKLESEQNELREIIDINKETLKEKQSLRQTVASGQDITKILNKKILFVEKSLRAITEIKEQNKNTALEDVNKKLSYAYQAMSEDYERGRRIKIIEFNERKKYQMTVYMENDVNNLIEKWKNDGTYNLMLSEGKSIDEIIEDAITRCADSNSTGQSKINTFSFVKAILDYSNNPTSHSGIEIKKEYPLLIDAPFGDIASENLEKSSSELHNFSHQVILFIDKEKYDSLRHKFDEYTCDKWVFEKVDGKNHSIILEG